MAVGESKLKKGKVDLHVHSIYSDGTLTPAELLALAEERGVKLFAVADHDVLEGSKELVRLSAGSEVRCVPAVELTGFDSGVCVHVLAYGYSFADSEFAEYVKINRRKLDEMSDRLIEAMERAGEPVSGSEYASFEHNKRLGGWKALHYLVEKGITRAPLEGLPLYPRYGVGYGTAGFPPVAELCKVIHRAGAIAVLAHPGVTLGAIDLPENEAKLLKLISMGIDGIECYYPQHSPATVARLLALCDELGLYVTSGSDSHGAFTGAELGIIPVTLEDIRFPFC